MADFFLGGFNFFRSGLANRKTIVAVQSNFIFEFGCDQWEHVNSYQFARFCSVVWIDRNLHALIDRIQGKGRCQFQIFSWAVTGGSSQLIHMSPLYRNFPWLRQRECWNSSSAMGFHCWKAVNAWRVWLFGDHRGRCSRSWTQSQGHVEVDLLLLRDRIPQHRS